MNILIDIGHPAHVHVFKHFAHVMQSKGHKVLFTCREKEFIIKLLQDDGLPYVSLGKKYKTTLTKVWGLVEFDYKIWRVAKQFKPDMFLSLGSMYAAQVAFIMRKPHICFEDTYNMEQVRFYEPFTDIILTGDYEHPRISKKEYRMPGYNELAYLHPNRFTPSKHILKELGVSEDEKYVIVRFVSWEASHDRGHKGISMDMKVRAVEKLSKHAKVFITSEGTLPEALKRYQIKINPSRIHDAIAFSSLVYGESSTMAEEAAMLGVPSLFFNDKSTYYTQHLERDYDLMFNLGESDSEQEKGLQIAASLLTSTSTKDIYRERTAKMLKDRIDVTAFLVWLVECYPESADKVKENDFVFQHFSKLSH